jgi:hypothetical protein
MPGSVGKLKADLIANTGQFRTEMRDAGKDVKQFGSEFANVGKNLVSGLPGGGLLAGLFSGPGALATAGAATMVSMIALAKSSLGEVRNMQKDAKRMGVTTGGLDIMQLAAKKSNTDMGSVESALFRLRKSLYDLSRPEDLGKVEGKTAGAKNAFRELGITARQLKDMTLDETFFKIADAIEKIPSAAGRANIEMAIFGKGGAAIDAMLRQIAKRREMTGAKPYSPEARFGLGAAAEEGQTIRGILGRRIKEWFGSAIADVQRLALGDYEFKKRMSIAQAEERRGAKALSDADEKQARMDALTERAEGMREKLLSPGEQLRKQMDFIREAQTKKAFTATEAGRAASLAVEDYRKAVGVTAMAPIAEEGSQAAYSAWAEAVGPKSTAADIFDQLKLHSTYWVQLLAAMQGQAGFQKRPLAQSPN